MAQGDFPAFYAPAVILERGQQASLYTIEAQQGAQNEFWPGLKGSFHFFAYPPFVAQALRPLAFLSPLQAKALFCCLLLAAALLCCRLLKTISPVFTEQPALAATSALKAASRGFARNLPN